MTHTVDECINIVRKHQEQGGAVDVVAIGEEMGIRFFKTEGWKDFVSGMIRKEEEGYTIYVNANHTVKRRRYTAAHELAHYILHKREIGDRIGNSITDDSLYRSGLSNATESEANYLAEDILMPEDQVNEMWLDPMSSLDKMAKYFNVSKQAMAVRLRVPN